MSLEFKPAGYALFQNFNKIKSDIFDFGSNAAAQINDWAKGSFILLPIILSLFSALIFWLVFSYIPEKSRRNKLRPVVEVVIYGIYKELFSLFDLALRHAKHSPSMYQEEIRSGKLTEEIISMGLQNKCLNETYLYDPAIKDSLIAVGREMHDRSREIENLADKVISFHTYATAQEIILFEKIREKLRIYQPPTRDVERDSGTVVGGQVLRPINPTISYRAKNLYELYKLFGELQDIFLRTKSTDRSTVLTKVQILFYSGRLKECRRLSNYGRRVFRKDSALFGSYLARCECKLGNIRKFYRAIEDTYRNRPYNGSLISARSTFKNILGNEKILEILSKYYTDEEINNLKQKVSSDRSKKEAFEMANNNIRRYLSEKKSH